MIFPVQQLVEMKFALILTFSPWEKEQQGPSSDCRIGLLGRPVRLSQGLLNHGEVEVQGSKFKLLGQARSNHSKAAAGED